MISITRGLVAAATVSVLAASGSSAQEDFYAGKTITIYVGYSAGGGYDGDARLLGSYIGSHIPGNPEVIVENMGGAGSMTLANFLYNSAPKDGTVFGIIGAGIPFNPLIGSKEQKQTVRFEPLEFNWIGSMEQFTYIGVTWADSGIESIDQMKEKEVTYGSSGAGGNEIFAHLLNELLGTKLKPIRGYRGSSDIALAMERGEVDGFVGWCWTCMTAMRPDYVDDKLVNTFVQFGLEPDPAMPDVPHFLSLVEDPADKQVVELIASTQLMARPFVAPPGVPADRVEILRKAFEDALSDPALLEGAKTAKRDIVLYSGEQIDALLKKSYELPEEVVARAASIVSPAE